MERPGNFWTLQVLIGYRILIIYMHITILVHQVMVHVSACVRIIDNDIHSLLVFSDRWYRSPFSYPMPSANCTSRQGYLCRIAKQLLLYDPSYIPPNLHIEQQMKSLDQASKWSNTSVDFSMSVLDNLNTHVWRRPIKAWKVSGMDAIFCCA